MRMLSSVLGRLRRVWGEPGCSSASCPPGCGMHRTSTFSLRRERPAPLAKLVS
jgi:hypothetical protein